MFEVQGSYGHRTLDSGDDQPVMKNVFFSLKRDTNQVFGTTVDFRATVGSSVGEGDAPRIPFFITGNFSSLGGGSCGFTAALEIDRNGNVIAANTNITSGDATIDETGTVGTIKVTL